MNYFTQMTLAQIREAAFTKPEFEILLDLLPEDLPPSTVFYDIEYLCETEIPKLVQPLVKEITEVLKERYPFLNIFGFDENMERDYNNYYFSEVDCLDLPRELVEGTELEYLEALYWRSEGSEPAGFKDLL